VKKSLQEAQKALEGSGGYLLDLPPHDNLQKVSVGLRRCLTTKDLTKPTPMQMGAYQIRRRKSTERRLEEGYAE
jgi:hypothetical protein